MGIYSRAAVVLAHRAQPAGYLLASVWFSATFPSTAHDNLDCAFPGEGAL